MKPEEALRRVERAQVRVERMAHGRGGRAQLESYLNESEALRIVLAMAKAAQGMAEALGDVPLCIREFGYEAFCAKPKGHAEECRATWGGACALAAFRKASGGDAPEGPRP